MMKALGGTCSDRDVAQSPSTLGRKRRVILGKEQNNNIASGSRHVRGHDILEAELVRNNTF